VLVGLAAVLVRVFSPDGRLVAANATDTGATSLPANSVVLRDSCLGLVVLTGALGAIVSAIRGFDWEGFTDTTDPTVTEPTQMVEGLLARIAFGSVSALFLVVLARSEFGAVVLAEGLLGSPMALPLIAFVAGFSQNLILQLLSDIVDRLSPRESGGASVPGRTDGEPPPGGDGPSSEGGNGGGAPGPGTHRRWNVPSTAARRSTRSVNPWIVAVLAPSTAASTGDDGTRGPCGRTPSGTSRRWRGRARRSARTSPDSGRDVVRCGDEHAAVRQAVVDEPGLAGGAGFGHGSSPRQVLLPVAFRRTVLVHTPRIVAETSSGAVLPVHGVSRNRDLYAYRH
jgi:hypothetical protein